MKNLYNNKNLFDWIVWICIIAISINALFPFKFAFWVFVIMVLSIARYNNLADKEIARLINECETKDDAFKSAIVDILKEGDAILKGDKPCN